MIDARRTARIRLVAVVLCAAGAAATWAARLEPRRATAEPAGPAATTRAPAVRSLLPPVPVSGVGPARVSPSAARIGVPIRLRIPTLHVDTALDRLVRLPDGSLSTPARWEVPGWYAGGPRPGEVGPAVIAGHVDSTSGPAVFFGLRRLRPGASVDVVTRGGRTLHFVVADVRRVPKNRFPTALVYGPQPVPVLRLVTCTGDFDRSAHSYVDNLVVSAYRR